MSKNATDHDLLVASRDGRCPRCLSAHIASPVGEAEFNGCEIIRPVACLDCGATWADVYTLNAVRDLAHPAIVPSRPVKILTLEIAVPADIPASAVFDGLGEMLRAAHIEPATVVLDWQFTPTYQPKGHMDALTEQWEALDTIAVELNEAGDLEEGEAFSGMNNARFANAVLADIISTD